jgi:hypothetical protein
VEKYTCTPTVPAITTSVAGLWLSCDPYFMA